MIVEFYGCSQARTGLYGARVGDTAYRTGPHGPARSSTGFFSPYRPLMPVSSPCLKVVHAHLFFPRRRHVGSQERGQELVCALTAITGTRTGHVRATYNDRRILRVFSSTYGSVRCSHMHRTDPYMHRTVTVR